MFVPKICVLLFLFVLRFYSVHGRIRRNLHKCPPGSYRGMVPDVCYYLQREKRSWLGAEWDCNSKNGHLASIDSDSENVLLQNLASSKNMAKFWLGGTNLVANGSWMWSDGGVLDEEYWILGNSTRPNQCLLSDSTNGIWTRQECHTLNSYACKVIMKNEKAKNNAFVYPCPEGWIYGEPTNKCYKFINLTSNYTSMDEATKICESYDPNSSLLSIHSYVENNLVSSFQFWKLGYWAIWLGLYCENKVCTWSDGSKYSFSLWEGGESPYEWDGCVIMTGAQGDHYRQKWEVVECAFQAGFWNLACQTNAKNVKKLRLL